MLHAAHAWFCATPRRLVLLGLWMFFAGSLLLLAGLGGQLALLGQPTGPETLASLWPLLPTGLVPEGALGFTAAATLVSWGVWAMGAAVRLQRRGQGDAALQPARRQG